MSKRSRRFLVAVIVSGHLVTLTWLAAVTWMLADFVKDKLDDQASFSQHASRLDSLSSFDTPRLPLGEPIIGEAMADYALFRTPEITPFRRRLLGEDGRLRQLDAKERAFIKRHDVKRIVEAFVRASRREVAGELDKPVWALELYRRTKFVTAAAIDDASHGRRIAAWSKALALTRFAHDFRGRTTAVEALLAAKGSRAARELLAQLADGADPQLAARWLLDIERVQLDQLDESALAEAIVSGEARWLVKALHDASPSEESRIEELYIEPTLAFAEAVASNKAGARATRVLCAGYLIETSSCEVIGRSIDAHVELGADLDRIEESLAVRVKGGK